MSQIKVIGIGSPFADDQLGWQAVKILQDEACFQSFIPKIVSFECHDRPNISLLEVMKGTKASFLIDAVKSGNPVGTLHRFCNMEIANAEHTLSTHAMGIPATIALGHALNLLPETLIFYGIEIENTDMQTQLTPVVNASLPTMIANIRNELLELIHAY